MCPALVMVHEKQQKSHESPSKMCCLSTKSIGLVPMIIVFQFSKPDQKEFRTRHVTAAITDRSYKLSRITAGLQSLFLSVLFLSLYLHPQIKFTIFLQQIKIMTGKRSNSTMCFLFNVGLFPCKRNTKVNTNHIILIVRLVLAASPSED